MGREHKGKSLVLCPNSYIVLDLETTGFNAGFDDIIEISALKISNGIIVDTFSTLINPNRYIEPNITELTGISNEMVKDAPLINNAIDSIISFIGDCVIVGHNVHFDVNFLYDNYYGLRGCFVTNDVLDTLRLSRKFFKNLKHHTLEIMANYFDQVNKPTHRAMSDCKATFELLTNIQKYIQTSHIDVEEAFRNHNSNNNRISVKDIKSRIDCIDEDNPLFGMRICFTGGLEKMVRREALQLVADSGGIPSNSVTQETDFLVLGDNDYKEEKAGFKSRKYKKAESLMLKNFPIKIITETTFFDMLDDNLVFATFK